MSSCGERSARGGRACSASRRHRNRNRSRGRARPSSAAPPPQVKHVAFSTPTPALPPKLSYWDQVRQQESRWEDEMNGLLTLVQEQPPAALREPQAAVSACIEQKMKNADRTSSYFEYLVRHGDAIETGLVGVQRTAQRLCDLLEQSPAAEPSLGSRPLTEHGIRWAVAAIRRGEEPAEAAAILGASSGTSSRSSPASRGTSGMST